MAALITGAVSAYIFIVSQSQQKVDSVTQFFLKTFLIIGLLAVVCLGLVTIIGTVGGSSRISNGSRGDPIGDATINDIMRTRSGKITRPDCANWAESGIGYATHCQTTNSGELWI